MMDTKKAPPVGRPRTNKPTRTRAIKGNTEQAESRSKSAKENDLGGKVDLTEDQKKSKSENQKKNALRPSQEAELQSLWESGEFTLRELSDKFNRAPETLSRYFSSRGIEKGAKAEEFAKKVNDRILEELMGDAGETARKIKTMKDEAIQRHEVILKMTQQEIAIVKQKGLPLQNALPNIRALKEWQSILETARKEMYTLLNAEEFESRIEQDDVPELVVSELTAEDIKELRRTQLEISSLEEGASDDIIMPDDDENEIIDES